MGNEESFEEEIIKKIIAKADIKWEEIADIGKEKGKDREKEMRDKEPFYLLEPLRAGGFNHTYLAKVIDDDLIEEFGAEEVVLKIPVSRKKERIFKKGLEMNIILAQHAKYVNVENFARFLGFSYFRGQVVIAMEYIKGSSLRKMLGGLEKPKRLPAEVATRIALGVLNGLAIMHKINMIHRNIKPEGIVMAGSVPKITNIFLAEILNPEDPVSNDAVGTIPYISPEMLKSSVCTPGVSYSSDIWSLGVMFYEMLTARLPFGSIGKTPLREAVNLIVNKQHTPICEVCGDIPVELSEIVDCALRKDPNDRYGTATEMREALCNFLEDHPADLEEVQRT